MSTYTATHQGIRTWNEDDRPREKLILKGKKSLSDAELIAILLGSGSKNEDAVSLAKRILANNSNSLNQLAKQSIDELKKFKGVGEAKAINIVAALELGRRKKELTFEEQPRISSPKTAYEILRGYFEDLQHEEFRALFLNRANRVISNFLVSSGGVSGTVVDSKILFKEAILKTASGIVLAHNHPSGNLKPSNQDISVTNKIAEICKHFDMNLLDHLIISPKGFFSFSENNLI
jgi:DNA repair protein RadC